MSRHTIAVTIDIPDADGWIDPHNLAEYLVGVAISNDYRGLSTPHPVAVQTNDSDQMKQGTIIAVEQLATALHNGTIHLVSTQPIKD